MRRRRPKIDHGRAWVLTDCAARLHLEGRMAQLTTEDASAVPDPDGPVLRAVRELLTPGELALVEQVAAGVRPWHDLGDTSGEPPADAGPFLSDLLHRPGEVVALEDRR